MVASATKCHHGGMPARTGQRSFRLNDEKMAKTWDDALAESGLSQQKALETLIEAIGARLIDLSELRADLVKRARQAKG